MPSSASASEWLDPAAVAVMRARRRASTILGGKAPNCSCRGRATHGHLGRRSVEGTLLGNDEAVRLACKRATRPNGYLYPYYIRIWTTLMDAPFHILRQICVECDIKTQIEGKRW